MEPTSPGTTIPDQIKFRAGKKRKAYRQRTDDTDTNEPQPSSANLQAEASPEPTADDEPSVAAALKLRNARKSRLRGVNFTTTRTDSPSTSSTALALIPHAHDEPPLASMATRFTHQTGVLADLNDKHMMEFIESRLANTRAAHADGDGSPTDEAQAPSSSAPAAKPLTDGQEIMQGRLMEIDLGSREADGLEGAREPRAKRVRLGRDGKPWRPRNRRGSDAVKRDQMVEEILRENRLDVYDVPSKPSDPEPEADGAADERLAEEFRRQFLDDVAQRQLKKKKTTQPARPGTEDVLKGPKLGGSRNVRAAMRDMLLKKEKEGKK